MSAAQIFYRGLSRGRPASRGSRVAPSKRRFADTGRRDARAAAIADTQGCDIRTSSGGRDMSTKTLDADAIMARATPITNQHAHEIQPYGHLVRMPIALSEVACKEAVESLNQLLADTITLRDLYKKHHWQVAGPTFYQLHLLFDKHA